MDIGLRLSAALRKHVEGAEIFDGVGDDVGFEPWNGAMAERPLARILCASADDVSAALQIALDVGVPVSVCAGRKDVHGRNSRSGHLVLDLRKMDSVVYDGQQGSVAAGGGATTRHLLGALPPDMVVPTAINDGVGIVAASAGGGYGSLCGSFGLMCDALAGAEVVLANGERVAVDASGHDDLFWALRGGGTGFGVVTSVKFSTFRCERVMAGRVGVPMKAAEGTLLAVQDMLDAHPDALGLVPTFAAARDGVALTVSFVWNGPEAVGRDALRRLTDVTGARLMSSFNLRYRETLDRGMLWPWGKHWHSRTNTLDRITPAVAHLLTAAAGEMRPGAVLFLHDFHGHAARVPSADTAFPLRSPHFVAAVVARWQPGDTQNAVRQRNWVEWASGRLAPQARPGGYINFLAPDEYGRVCEGFQVAADRLAAIKARVDPSDRFRCATGRLTAPDPAEDLPRRPFAMP